MDFDWDIDRILGIEMDWGSLGFVDLIVRLAFATVLGGLLGIERERLERSAGFRTHALVSVASALMMIVSTYGFPVPADGVEGGLDPSRIAAQVVSGIGFLGAGVIIFRENTIRGLTTAATIWAVAGIGLAAGGGLLGAAVVGTFFMLLISAGFRPLERRLFAHHAVVNRVIVTTTEPETVMSAVMQALSGKDIDLRTVQFDRKPKGVKSLVELTLRAENRDEVIAAIDILQQAPGVTRVGWRRGASTIRRAGMTGIRVREYSEDPDEDDSR